MNKSIPFKLINEQINTHLNLNELDKLNLIFPPLTHPKGTDYRYVQFCLSLYVQQIIAIVYASS